MLRNPGTGAVTVSAFQDDVAIIRVYMRLGYAIGRPVLNRPDGTQGIGTPFKSVKKAAAAAEADTAAVAEADRTAAEQAGQAEQGRGRRNRQGGDAEAE